MKSNWLIGILSVLIVFSMNAQQKKGLYIDACSGAVQLKVRGAGVWDRPAHKQSVTRLDSVRVPKQAKMDVVDAVTGNVYPCNFAFFGTVNQCMQRAKDNQSDVLTALANQLMSNVLGKTKNNAHHVYGGATRTDEEEDRYNDSIACLALAAAHAKHSLYPNLTLRTIRENGIVRFVIDNADKNAYYVNVLMRNTRTDEVAFRIVLEPDVAPEALLLPAGQTLDLSMFRFLEQSDMQYILFATESPFVSANVNPLLRYSEDLNCK